MSFKYNANTLKKLEQLLEECLYTLRYEKGNFNSGFCLLEERKVIVINKFLNIEGRINAIIELLNNLNLDEQLLSGDMLKWLASTKIRIQKDSSSLGQQTEIDI